MPETSEITRRWSGYICPDCRFVFRVPRDHDGRGVVCPSCKRLLRLPVVGEPLPPLVTNPIQKPEFELSPPDEAAVTPQGELRKRRRRGSRGKESASPAWEQQAKFLSKRPEKSLTVAIIGGAALLLIVAVIIATRSKPAVVTPMAPVVEKSTPQFPPGSEKARLPDVPDVGQFLRLAEPIAKTFLEAKSVDEILPVVRHPDITGKHLNDRYVDGHFMAPGLQSFAEDGAVSIQQSTAVVKVRTGNFEQRDLCFVHTKDGWKVDWESWVGWSDISWEMFAEKAPTTPSRFRVRLKPIIYYNFGFTDDGKWRSYLIESPDGEHRFFGYVERGTPVDNLINLADSPGGGDFILDLAFPADNVGRNQVLIKDRIAVGWVEPESAESP